MSSSLNTPRSEALRGAPLDSWIALAEDETRVIATGATYEEVAKRLDDAGDKDSVILKTPKSWLPFAIQCGVRFAYKNYPRYKGVDDWAAALPVQVSNPAKHSPPCRKFEAIIDSGASLCLFHSSIGHGIGLNMEKGELDETVGVSGVPTRIYRHTISLHVLGNIFKIRAGFTDQLPLAGLLGRVGFFEHFKITFDPSSNPPGFDLERIYRA